MKLNSMDVWGHIAPMFHLVDVFAIYAITLVGGRHVTLPNFSPIEALLMMERECISVVNMASTMVSMLVNNPIVDTFDVSSLRVLSCGGSPQSPAVIVRAISIFGCEFFLSYGMTETCGKITMSILPEDMDLLDPSHQLDIICTSGRPFSMVDVRVVNEDGIDVPKDNRTVGEVWVSGPTVFDGYVGLDHATSGSFTDGWFKTGDLAVARPDNYIMVVDRKKDMLLVGGENVYTTEVEAVLHNHPAVHQAAVFGIPNRVMGELVGAAVTLVPDTDVFPTNKDLISWCRKHLAEYKVPSIIHILDVFPTTGSGKILKTKLREMFAGEAKEERMLSSESTNKNEIQNVCNGRGPDEYLKSKPVDLAGVTIENIVEELVQTSLLSDAIRISSDTHPGDFGALCSELSYLVVINKASDIPCCCEVMDKAKLYNLAFICLEKPTPNELMCLSNCNFRANIVCLDELSFRYEDKNSILGALAIIRARCPPIGGLFYWSSTCASSDMQQTTSELSAEHSKREQNVLLKIKTSIIAAIEGLVGKSTASQIESGDPLMAAGITSTLAVQLASELEKSFGIQVPGTLAFDYPSLEEMVGYFHDEIHEHRISDGDEMAGQKLHPEKNVSQVSSSNIYHPIDVKNQRHHPYSYKEHQATKSNVIETIKDNIYALLGTSDEISDHAPLMDAGVSSTLAVQLVSALEGAFGIELPGTLVFDYPSVSDIADYIIENSYDLSQAELVYNDHVNVSTSIGVPLKLIDICHQTQKNIPMCVVTSAAHEVPGGSLNLQFQNGNDRITLVPLERWDTDISPLDNPLEFNLQFGAFLDDVDLFDANLFGVSPAEAILMDPQQRLVMSKFSESLASHNAIFSASKSTGIFVGVSQLDYARIAYETGSALNTYYATGSHLSVTSGRLSYTHGFKGPAVTVDTACSSSLVTTHLAVQSLYNGECIVAGSVGVNLTLVHSWTRACLRAGMLAEDGRCKTLDASADGYVRAEAIGALLLTLMPNEDIKVVKNSDGDGLFKSHYLAMISGTSVNQDGRSSSLTAPNGPAQQEVMLGAMEAASIAGSDISNLQMHGTGTPLGDPIELGAASAVLLRRGSTRNSPLQLSGAKSFVGHGEPAAGMVGLTRIALSLTSLSSDYFLTLRTVNAYVSATISNSLQNGQSCIAARELAPFSFLGSQVHGGVSAFAFQGTNAHAIVSKNFLEGNGTHFSLSNLSINSLKALSVHKTRYWVLPKIHSFVRHFSRSKGNAGSCTAVFEGDIMAPRIAGVYGDHQVFDKILFPAAGMIEVVLQSGMTALEHAMDESLAVTNLVISSPIILPKSIEKLKQAEILKVQCSIDTSNGSFVLSHHQHNSSHSDNTFGNILKYCNSFGKRKETLAAYAKVFSGPSLQRNSFETGAPIGIVVCNASFFTEGYIVPPPVLDSNFHLGVAAPECGAKVPISMGCYASTSSLFDESRSEMNWFASTTSAYAALKSGHDIASFNLEGQSGISFAQLSGLETKIVSQKPMLVDHSNRAPITADYLYDLEYRVLDKRKKRKGFYNMKLQSSASVRVLSNDRADLYASLKLNKIPSCVGIVALEMIQAIRSDPNAKALVANIIETMDNLQLEHQYSSQQLALQAGSFEGLLRVSATEMASFDFNLSSIQPQSIEIEDVAIQYQGSLPNLRERNGSVAVPRLKNSEVIIPALDQLQIRPQPRGSLYNLAPLPFNKKSCDRNNVRIAVKAVGINFRDVLNILGMYPGDPGPPGSDCAGIIVATGSSVTHFQAGDAVFGFAHGCLGTSVECPASTLANMPDNVSFLEASTVPTVFTTVHIALQREACIKKGQNVLVHAAAGGVGLAAIQLAHANRANVIATAGGPSKRAHVRTLGIQHVIGSRDTAFVSDVCILSGVDIVLNSLTSTGMVAGSVASLRMGGKFIEISKRDIWSAGRGIQERPDMHFSLLAVDFLPASVIQSTLKSIAAMLGSGKISPLRNICHSMGNVSSALRQLTQASHIGKVVTTPLKYSISRCLTKHPNGGIAITGGSGGLALMISEWITKRHETGFACLISRSGRIMDKIAASSLLNSSAVVSCAMGDVGTTSDVLSVLDPTENGLLCPITSLFHASGILQDAMLDKQTARSFQNTFAPKLGAVDSIDFVARYSPMEGLSLFSSVASLLGGAGQGNYAAANAAFDAWSFKMQVCGFHSMSIQWGAWSSSGMATESVLRRLQRIGQGSISADQGLATLSILLGGVNTHVQPVFTVNDFDWSTYLKSSCPPVFEEFKSDKPVAADEAHSKMPKKKGKSKSDAQHSASPTIRESVHQQVESAIVQVLGTSIGDDEPLMSAGLDSLGSVEFSNVLASKLGIQMPGTLVFDYPSVALVTDYLVSQIDNSAEARSDSSFDENLTDYSIDSCRLVVETDTASRSTIVIASTALRHLISHDISNYTVGEISDRIQRIPNNRWDLDVVPRITGDAFTMPAQVWSLFAKKILQQFSSLVCIPFFSVFS